MSLTYEIPAGTVLGKYEVLRKLATGGMAEIYVARTRGAAGFEKLVVLKRILPNVAQDPAFVQMFLAEARLAATLSHPNIADVYDVGEASGTYFFTMELVHGEDARTIRFATKKRNERPPLSIALAIVHGTAGALDYAHEKGVVHRDISASNVLVSYDGAVKLVDFGIARASSSEHKTRTGTLKGKIPYMSPEQCRGHALDRRSDLFSLGTVLYELTVGRRPFRGENDFAMMEQIVHHDARPPTQIDAAYPRKLEAIVLKLLARDIEKRYQTAEHLLFDLEEYTRENGLWATPKAIGKYMRSLFADKIEAWEAAERAGVSLDQHVQQTITNRSAQSQQSASSALLVPSSTNAPLPFQPVPTGAIPTVKPSRRGLVIGMAAVLTLAGVGGGYYALSRERVVEKAPAPAPATVVVPVVVPTPAPAPAVAAPKPEVVVEEEKTEQPEKTVKRQPGPAKRKHTPKPAAKPQPTPPKPAEKEKTWDPNSPFLPPSS